MRWKETCWLGAENCDSLSSQQVTLRFGGPKCAWPLATTASVGRGWVEGPGCEGSLSVSWKSQRSRGEGDVAGSLEF